MDRVFQGYSEGKILFQPTFKYDKGTNQFDSSSKYRPPAWTDRVLYNMAERSPLTEKEEEIVRKPLKGKGLKKRQKQGEKRTLKVSDSITDINPTDSSKDEGSSAPPPKGPAWAPQLSLTKYYSVDSRHSDHRPVCAEFRYRP